MIFLPLQTATRTTTAQLALLDHQDPRARMATTASEEAMVILVLMLPIPRQNTLLAKSASTARMDQWDHLVPQARVDLAV